MSSSNPSSSSSLRFLDFSDHAPIRIQDPLELYESDVVRSFAVSTAQTPSLPPNRHQEDGRNRRQFSLASSSLSAALSSGDHHFFCRKYTVMVNSAARQVGIPHSRFHQSTPINISMWPEEF